MVDAAQSKIPVFGARKRAMELQYEVAELRATITKYGIDDITLLEATKAELTTNLAELKSHIAQAQSEIEILNRTLIDVRSNVEVQDMGIYDYEHPAQDSVVLSARLATVRQEIKTLIKASQATTALPNFTFNNSAAQGKKFVRDMS